MAKKLTALQLVQQILNSMDSDEVEAYDETIESNQVMLILEGVFEEIMDRRDWEFTKHRPRQLDAGTGLYDLTIPADVVHVECIRYHNFDTGRPQDVRYVSPKEFLHKYQDMDTSLSYITSYTVGDGVAVGLYNDRAPTEWTSFDEDTIVFNAYDSTNEVSGVTVGSSTTLATVAPSWTRADAFIPDIPARMFTLLLNEAISRCWLEIKQEANPKAEQVARRQYIKMRELERRAVEDKEEVNYGR